MGRSTELEASHVASSLVDIKVRSANSVRLTKRCISPILKRAEGVADYRCCGDEETPGSRPCPLRTMIDAALSMLYAGFRLH